MFREKEQEEPVSERTDMSCSLWDSIEHPCRRSSQGPDIERLWLVVLLVEDVNLPDSRSLSVTGVRTIGDSRRL